MRRYQGFTVDSTRWDRFEFRFDDLEHFTQRLTNQADDATGWMLHGRTAFESSP